MVAVMVLVMVMVMVMRCDGDGVGDGDGDGCDGDGDGVGVGVGDGDGDVVCVFVASFVLLFVAISIKKRLTNAPLRTTEPTSSENNSKYTCFPKHKTRQNTMKVVFLTSLTCFKTLHKHTTTRHTRTRRQQQHSDIYIVRPTTKPTTRHKR